MSDQKSVHTIKIGCPDSTEAERILEILRRLGDPDAATYVGMPGTTTVATSNFPTEKLGELFDELFDGIHQIHVNPEYFPENNPVPTPSVQT